MSGAGGGSIRLWRYVAASCTGYIWWVEGRMDLMKHQQILQENIQLTPSVKKPPKKQNPLTLEKRVASTNGCVVCNYISFGDHHPHPSLFTCRDIWAEMFAWYCTPFSDEKWKIYYVVYINTYVCVFTPVVLYLSVFYNFKRGFRVDFKGKHKIESRLWSGSWSGYCV